MSLRSSCAICSVFVLSWLAIARESAPSGCGTHIARGPEEVYLHHQAERKRGLNRGVRARALAASAASTNRDFGNIAVIDDADGVVGQRNDFNLSQKTVSFLPSAADGSRYRVRTTDMSFDTALADAGSKLDGLGDDDARPVSLPFAFPYFGATYRRVWVNSDGNLTFGGGDANSTDRSLGRLVGGAPRIAPLFTDLDPSAAAGDSGVRVFSEPRRVVITWKSVPVYSDFGPGALQTFQVRLFPDGKIEFAFTNNSITDAVTGISPGRLNVALALVSFASGPEDEYAGPVADRFSGSPAVDVATVAQKFYATHEDAYDYLVIYNGLGVQASQGAVAYEVTVRNQRTGYGDGRVQIGDEFGSKRRLQSVLNMGPLNQYPADPNGIVSARGPTGDTSLTVLGHETGHLFLAFASVRGPADPTAQPMLGRAMVHWSFNFNSEASFMEGTRILDQGERTSPRFLTSATVQGYSPLDQYLMGFRAPEEVPPTFLVTGSGYAAVTAPRVGVSFDGNRRDVAVDEIISAEGRRTPDYTVAQRRFRFAFILVTHAGQVPPADQIAKVDGFRGPFEEFYAKAASNRAVADTKLKRAVQLSAFPAAGVLAGRDGAAVLSLDLAADRSQTFTLATSTGAAQAPASVTVLAGAVHISFAIHGVREGVDELIATPADSSYEMAVAKVQVKSDTSGLSLQLLSPDKVATTAGVAIAPVEVRVTDINQLPYAGVRVSATVPNGTVDPTFAITDETGIATFRWIPSASTGQLRAAIEGASISSATVTLVAQPVVSANGVVNAASYVPGLTPGSLATIFGSGLSNGDLSAQVLVNGIAASVSYVSDKQINFTVPDGLTGTSANIEVENSLGHSAVYTSPVKPLSPGIFTGGNNTAAVLFADPGLQWSARLPQAGDVLEIFTTGLGATAPSATFPGFQDTITRPQVLIGNVPATVIIAAPLAQFPGLYQINATVASGTPSGDQPMVVIMNGIRSNEARIRMQ